MQDDTKTSPHRAIGSPLRPSKVPLLREACLVILYGEFIGRRVPLRDATVVVGRAAEADLQFEEESVSRRHCRFEPVESGAQDWRVVDLGSTNGVFVNDRSVQSAALADSDRVQIGRNILKFLASGHIEAAYYEEIYRLVTSDGLTGLANRRAFVDSLAREFSRAHRYGRPMSMLMIDIDHFKDVNDTFGHLAGDATLRQLGALLRANLRRDDTVGRLGGEEFAVLLPEIDLAGARITGDKIRRLVASKPFEYEGTPMPLSISLGVVTRMASDTDAESMMRRADELLYAAKRSGRNRVEG